ncbi:piggyBac transposable element-derived protein 4-like [Schistocerca serialis cubense]|uniref:piggyBac transposable element-derived protein 4-like n=1 Tax=Schistocerca serialis cubense TaxID=2023355 RepID=UPI00214ED27C|nr:piggyBac transposable element-derived protein 4-like [Schistocerca serialis cubense]
MWTQTDSTSDNESDIVAEDIDLDSQVPRPVTSNVVSESESDNRSENDSDYSFTSEDNMPLVRQFIDDGYMQILVTETYKYATQTNVPVWKPTTIDEMYVSVAVILLQSIVNKPTYQMYWTKRAKLATSIFREVLPFKRFVNLKKNLHFSDNATNNAESHPQPKLNKVWPIESYLSAKFRNSCVPERDVTIDESLLLYKGQQGWIQYLLLKRARFGIKTFMLCESQTGYVLSLIIYVGKGTTFEEEYKDLPMLSQTVMTLMQPLLNMGYCLTLDNYYSSPQLADFLLTKSTDMYGTVRPTRKEMSPSFRTKKLKKGEVAAFQ